MVCPPRFYAQSVHEEERYNRIAENLFLNVRGDRVHTGSETRVALPSLAYNFKTNKFLISIYRPLCSTLSIDYQTLHLTVNTQLTCFLTQLSSMILPKIFPHVFNVIQNSHLHPTTTQSSITLALYTLKLLWGFDSHFHTLHSGSSHFCVLTSGL